MASNSEKTHAKNLENLHVANVTIATITEYNTNNPLILKPALLDFETSFAARMQAVNVAVSSEQAAVGAQTAAFKLIPARVTKIVKAAKGQSLTPEAMAHLMTTVRRLRGVRVSDKTPDNPATPGDESGVNHSVSRRSIAGILESLDLLDEQLSSNPAYAPNETEHRPGTINTWVSGLRGLHDNVLAVRAATTDSRQSRDHDGYNKTDGLLPRVSALKAYVESILDKSDARLKTLKRLKFVDIKR